jgi:hypothetical protein
MILSDLLCRLLGHMRSYRKFSCYVCHRCWQVVVPKRVAP